MSMGVDAKDINYVFLSHIHHDHTGGLFRLIYTNNNLAVILLSSFPEYFKERVRPDYSVFDEVRKTRDFQIFSDLRLAGVGMVGVVHASDAIDAIQRFISRLDIGIIPHVIDTVIFVKDGEVKKVLDLSFDSKSAYWHD